MRAAIYARVSTKKQETEMQLTDLRKYVGRMGWEPVEYIEKASSVKRHPVFEQLLRDAQACEVQANRSVRAFHEGLREHYAATKRMKVRLISATESVDSGNENPIAQLMIKLLALLAELERNIIVERVRAGVAEAKRQGKHCGRPRKVFRREEAAQLRKDGLSWRACQTAGRGPGDAPIGSCRCAESLAAGRDQRWQKQKTYGSAKWCAETNWFLHT